MILSAPWQSFETQFVRDMAWVLGSPSLLAPTHSRTPSGQPVHWLDHAWSERALSVSLDWLKALDQQPAPLLEVLAGRDSRLGRYFENLLGFWLAWPDNPLYRIVGQSLPVRSNNRTLGELDFLVEDRLSGELQHWEVAVKFYLGIQPGGAWKHWVGPALADRLDLKINRFMTHQLALPDTPECREMLHQLGLSSPAPVCMLKGRLFYPESAGIRDWAPINASPDHLKGWWMHRAEFLQRYAGRSLRWILLPKPNWLTPVAPGVSIGDSLDAHALIEHIRQAPDNRAIAVIGLDHHPLYSQHHHEVTRGFITPPGWPKDFA